MRRIRASIASELEKLCSELELRPTADLRGVTLEVDGEAVLIVGYDNWTDGSCVMHQWAKHPKYYGREILHEAFRYVFDIADKRVAIGIVRSDNRTALEVNRKIGFQTSTVIPDAYGPGVDMHILHLPRHLNKW